MQILNSVKQWIYAILLKVLPKIMPINQNKIVFNNFNGKGYGCNPKYIAEELLRQNTEYDLVWLVKDLNEEMPDGIRKVSYYGFRAKLQWLSAKMWISNVRTYHGVDKRTGQYYIQTWHSSLALKKVEGDIKDNPVDRVEESKYDGSVTDLMFANNDVRENQIRRAFWYYGPIMRCGVPRNSVLFENSGKLQNKIRKYFGIDENALIAMYAPTFRKNADGHIYELNFSSIEEAIRAKFKCDRAILLLRLHPNVTGQSDALKFSDSIINASYYPDMQELLAATDILISDFSSCIFDFAFAKKPVFLIAKDKSNYLKNERELLFSIDELPFNLAETEEELCDEIKGFSSDVYIEQCQVFFESIGLTEDGNGAKQVVEWIQDRMG